MGARADGISTRSYRMLAVVAAGLTMGFALVDRDRTLGVPLPLVERGLVALTCLAYAVATRFSPWAEARAGALFRLLLIGVSLWAISGGARSGVSVNDALGILTTTFAIGLVFPTALGAVGYYLLMTVAVGLALAVAPERGVAPTPLLGTLLTGAVATWFVARARTFERTEIAELELLSGPVNNGVLLLDAAGRVRRANEGFARMVGRTVAPGVAFVDLLSVADTRPEARARLVRSLESGTGGRFELAHAHAGGGAVWVAAEITPRPVGPGGGGFVAVLSDTTRAHATVSRILDAMSDALFIVSGGGTIDAVNPAACRLLDMPAEALVGAPLATLVVPDWRWSTTLEAVPASTPGSGAELLLLLLQGELDARLLMDLDLALRSRAGTVIPVLAAASTLPPEGDQPARLILVARDARDRRRLEEEKIRLDGRVQEAQKLESLGLLAGGIAHDFNNLLVGVLGNASLALQRLPGDSPVRPLLEAIDRSAHRAADLTRQMLAYAGKGQFVIEPVDLSELVDEMAELVDASLSKRAQLTLRLDSGLPAVEADGTQLRQLVMNLLTNASDALGDRDGVVLVSTFVSTPDGDLSRIHGNDLRGQRCVCLEVRDSGVGMDETTRRQMFDPFFTTKARGRGLGLAATLGIVRAHGGAIAVQSEPGAGTTVRVWFPASSRRAPARAAPPPPAAMDGSGVVLVVDDEDHVRRFIAAVLEDTGLEVVEARDGEEAVDIVRAQGGRIRVVLLDLTMPGMGGDAAFEAMRALRPDLPVILSSGFSEVDARRRFGLLGLAGFLQKPYRAATLLESVRGFIGG